MNDQPGAPPTAGEAQGERGGLGPEAAEPGLSPWMPQASSELRAELGGIAGYVDLLESEVLGPVNARQGAHLARIRHSVQHLFELVEEMNDLARIDSDGWDLVWERVDGRAEAQRAVERARPEVRGRELAFRVEGAPGPVQLDTDLDLLRRVLMMLLSHVARSTDRGFVVLSVEQGGGSVSYRVRGVGSGPAATRGEDAGSFGEGVGEGLAFIVARRLVGIMGGDVTAEGEDAYTVRLPSVRPDAQ